MTKYDMRKRGSSGAKARRIWLSDDLTTLKWGAATKLAKANALGQGSAGRPFKSDRESTSLNIASVKEVEYGRDGSPNFKKHGYPAPAWLCFTVRTATRAYDFSAASSFAARTAVVAITHAASDTARLPPGTVGGLIWKAARWHLLERWTRLGQIEGQQKKVLADLLWEYAADMVRPPFPFAFAVDLQRVGINTQGASDCCPQEYHRASDGREVQNGSVMASLTERGATRASMAQGTDAGFMSPGVVI